MAYKFSPVTFVLYFLYGLKLIKTLIEIWYPVFKTLSNICDGAFFKSNWIFLKKFSSKIFERVSNTPLKEPSSSCCFMEREIMQLSLYFLSMFVLTPRIENTLVT